jgi:hypothetical protein|tara:strand:- start:1352 stop:2026 length:675 start_codon:yes stop_codon:yes gene_type:complete
MKNQEMLNKIKTLLNLEVKLEEQKLENGTLIEADSFEKGKEIFIKTDDEKVAMPVGEYILEDGKLLVVEEEGIIADMRDPSDGVPAKEDAGKEKDEDGYKKEETEDLEEKKEEEEMDEEAAVGDWKGMEKRIKNLEDAIADLKRDKENKLDEEEEVEMENENNRQPKSRTIKEEFSKEELSAAAEPIKHSPEASFGEIKQKVFAKGQYKTTLDRVLNKLNNKIN